MKLNTSLIITFNILTIMTVLAFGHNKVITLCCCASTIITLIPLILGQITIAKISLNILLFFIALISLEQIISINNNFPLLIITFTSIIALIASAWAGFVTYSVPLIKFPKPSGKYCVGVKDFYWEDTKRKEKYDPNYNRELHIQIWYPAIANTGKQTLYIPKVLEYANKKVTKKLILAKEIIKEWNYAQPHAKEDAEIAASNSPFPVIIFSHGLGGICSFNTSHIEELVSHGYVVIGVNHTHLSYVTHLTDGRVIPFRSEFQISVVSMLKNKLHTHIKKLEKEFQSWIDDGIFVLNMLEQINSDPNHKFYNILDLNNIGVFGHSLGGAFAAELINQDSRVKAGASLDGAVWDQTVDNRANKPFLFLVGVLLGQNEYPTDKKLEVLMMTKKDWDNAIDLYKQSILKFCSNSCDNAKCIVFQGAGHFAFTDLALLPSWLAARVNIDIGTISSIDILNQTNRYLLDFFNKELK